jgi:hypothetical protein
MQVCQGAGARACTRLLQINATCSPCIGAGSVDGTLHLQTPSSRCRMGWALFGQWCPAHSACVSGPQGAFSMAAEAGTCWSRHPRRHLDLPPSTHSGGFRSPAHRPCGHGLVQKHVRTPGIALPSAAYSTLSMERSNPQHKARNSTSLGIFKLQMRVLVVVARVSSTWI